MSEVENTEQVVTDTGAENAVVEETNTEAEATAEAAAAGAAEAETEAGTPAEGEAAEPELDADGNPVEPEPEGYKANLKFKVMEKEYEIPEVLRSAITDEASEKEIRELCEKAQGLEVLKPRFQQARQERQKFFEESQGMKASIDGLRDIYHKATAPGGNIHRLDGFFKTLQIPVETVLQYAISKAKLAEMPEEQRNAILQATSAQEQADALQRNQVQTQDAGMEREQQIKTLQLENALLTPDPATKSVIADFDATAGKPGAFKDAVIRLGHLEYLQSNGTVDLSPEEAVQRVVAHWNARPKTGAPAAPTQAASGAQNPNASAKKAVVVQRTNRSIPNVAGRTASPLNNKPKSVDDLIKYRKEQYGS